MFHADRRRGITTPTIACRNAANAPNKAVQQLKRLRSVSDLLYLYSQKGFKPVHVTCDRWTVPSSNSLITYAEICRHQREHTNVQSMGVQMHKRYSNMQGTTPPGGGGGRRYWSSHSNLALLNYKSGVPQIWQNLLKLNIYYKLRLLMTST
jgi:hypothetical protein